jgi:hypothetical protein
MNSEEKNYDHCVRFMPPHYLFTLLRRRYIRITEKGIRRKEEPIGPEVRKSTCWNCWVQKNCQSLLPNRDFASTRWKNRESIIFLTLSNDPSCFNQVTNSL